MHRISTSPISFLQTNSYLYISAAIPATALVVAANLFLLFFIVNHLILSNHCQDESNFGSNATISSAINSFCMFYIVLLMIHSTSILLYNNILNSCLRIDGSDVFIYFQMQGYREFCNVHVYFYYVSN